MKLIDKSALVAEIERLFEKAGNSLGEYRNGAEHTLISINDFLDTLEVKEADLEKEIKKVQSDYKTIDEYEGYFATIYASDIELIAKHFFELGLNTSNPLTWEDMKDILDLYDEVTSMDYCSDIYEEMLKRYKAQKGE